MRKRLNIPIMSIIRIPSHHPLEMPNPCLHQKLFGNAIFASPIGRRRYPRISIVSAKPPPLLRTYLADSGSDRHRRRLGLEKQHCLLFVLPASFIIAVSAARSPTSMRIHTFFAAAFAAIASAHGTHGGGAHAGNYGEEARTDYPNWMARHMAGTQRIDERFAVHGHSALTARLIQMLTLSFLMRTEEHGMDTFDSLSFFTLHDFDSDGVWEREEMQRMYGLMDPSNRDVSDDRREEAYRELLRQLDANSDGLVSRDEFAAYILDGKTLPDLGFGPGHHGDDEYEYEVHHWNKYHNEDTKLEDLTHPEDIEHFKHHEELEDAEEKQQAMDKLSIIDANIPAKFLRVQQ